MAVPQVGKLDLWERVEKTDPQYTKPFNRGGGFKGTATNATWLARQATEVFGPMGIGWGLEIVDEDLMQGAPLDERGTHELIHRVRVQLWYHWQGQRGELTQFGQTVFLGRNKYGLFTDEEAPKKSLTDAMSKCLSLLGFSADIYLGRYDDNKYVQALSAEFRDREEAEARRKGPKLSEEQHRRLAELIERTGTDATRFCRFFKVELLRDLPAVDFERARRMLEKKKDPAA